MGIAVICLYLANFLFSYYWPIGFGSPPHSHPKKITATFGEPRGGPPPTRFHTGVDMVRNDGQGANLNVYGVEPFTEYVKRKGTDYIITNYHIFYHINPRANIAVDSPVTNTTLIGTTRSQEAHLHFTSATYQYHSSSNPLGDGYENNPIDSSFSTDWRFDSLYRDTTKPRIDSVQFWSDGLGTQYEDLNNLPRNTRLDIVVKGEEFTAYPDVNGNYAVDDKNGVYKLGYDTINFPNTYNLQFREEPRLWNINYVYDRSRSNESKFYYVVTNEMNSNGWVRFPTGGQYTIYIRLVDEQGNKRDTVVNVNVATGISEEPTGINIPTGFQLGKNRPDPFYNSTLIPFQLPKECEVSLVVYNRSGQK